MVKCFRLVMAAAALTLPLAAAAHARLMSASPSAGAILAVAPRALTLDFNESVRLAVLKISQDGQEISVAYDRSASTPHVVVPLPALGTGAYEVRWSALTADDGHVVKGSFSFVVRP